MQKTMKQDAGVIDTCIERCQREIDTCLRIFIKLDNVVSTWNLLV